MERSTRQPSEIEQPEQTVVIHARESIEITGVDHIEKFDDTRVILETSLGVLTLEGQDLEIQELHVDEGEFQVTGWITSVIYEERRQEGGPFLQRLFR